MNQKISDTATRLKKLSVSIASLALLSFTSLTSAQAQSEQEHQAMIAKLENKLGIEVESVSDSVLPGLYNLSTDKGFFYTTKDGGFLVQGRVLKIGDTIEDQTENELKKIRLAGVAQLSDSFIEFTAPKEKYVISVFTDTTCGYCQKLHSEMASLNERGITVRYLAFPRAGLNSDVYRNTVSIWCADDPKGAITQAKLKQSVPSEVCANKVAEHYKFGQKIGVNGTPNIILPDGTLLQGYVPAASLEQALKESS